MEKSRRLQSDKVCDICGDIGVPYLLVTCCRCKRATKHIYCMKENKFEVPDTWFCESEESEECAQSIQDGKVQDAHMKQKIPVQKLKKSKVMEITGKVQDAHMKQKIPARKFKKSKVMEITAEEVVSMISGRMVSNRQRSSSPTSPVRTPIRQRTSTSVPKLLRPKPAPILAFIDDVQPSTPMPAMTRQHASYDREGKIPKSKATAESSVGAEQDLSLSNHIKQTVVEHDPSSPTMHIIDEQRKRANNKSSGNVKTEEDCPSNGIRNFESKCDGSGFLDAIDEKLNIGTGKLAELDAINMRLRASHNDIAVNDLVTGGPGSVHCNDEQNKKIDYQEIGEPLRLLINPEEKLSNRPASEACWKGIFEVFYTISHVFFGQAHFPAQVSPKAYEISKKMPEELNFKMLCRTDVWPKIFKLDPPNKDDIGFYFFPCDQERSKEEYINLLNLIDSRDFAMQSYIGDVELLIFTSKQLPVDYQRIGAQTYLWGVLRHVRHRKSCQRIQEQTSGSNLVAYRTSNNCAQLDNALEGISGEGDMEVDMIGGIEIDRTDKPIPRSDVPPGFDKFHSKMVAHTTAPDIPPGLPRSHCSRLGIASPETSHIGLAYTSTGGDYEKHPTQACELQPRCHQVDGHKNKSAKHDSSNRSLLSSEAEKGSDRPNLTHQRGLAQAETRLESVNYKGEWISMAEIQENKKVLNKKRNAMKMRLAVIDGEAKMRVDAPPCFKTADHVRESPLVKFQLKRVASMTVPDVPPGFIRAPNSKHGITSPGAARATSPGILRKESRSPAFSSSGPGGYELRSELDQAAGCCNKSPRHDSSNLSLLSPKKEKGFNSMGRPNSTNPEADEELFNLPLAAGTKHDGNNLSMLFPEKVKWFSFIGGPRSTNQRSPSQAYTRRLQSETRKDIQRKDEDEVDERETTGCQSELNPINEQRLSGSSPCLPEAGPMLPPFPDLKLYPRDEFLIKQSAPMVYPDLCLSRPQYVRERTGWVSNSRELLEQDG